MNCTSGPVISEPNEANKSLPRIVIPIQFIVFFAAFFVIRKYMRWVKSKKTKKAQEPQEVTQIPIVPDWLLPLDTNQLSKHLVPQVSILCRPFEKKYDHRDEVELYKGAIEWCQKWMNKVYGEGKYLPNVTVPEDACLVSVPMNNFKCGDACTDFEPLFKSSSDDAYFTYQMFGDNRIQVTRYVEDGVERVAGYCIYIDSPYSSRYHYSDDVLIDLHTKERKVTGKVTGDPKASTVNPDETRISIEESPIRIRSVKRINLHSVSKNLQSNYCSSLHKPVTIGFDNGRTMHFEWNSYHITFKMNPCSTCQMDKKDENPPSYSLMFD